MLNSYTYEVEVKKSRNEKNNNYIYINKFFFSF